ncbi:uncharacterized protein LOC116143084 [Pistacia vera]|uniref:uncharacterized protein LOC116143084 n=1 Tax=Pistacia vera TaxID=55513 RepID=UPI0012637836|nr:uncharacterized protein LOC116143084 [Pistacia vera]
MVVSILKRSYSTFNISPSLIHTNTIAPRFWSWCEILEGLSLLSVLLAATAQSRCTALVCSCYVPSRSFNNKGEESSRSSNNISKKRLEGEDKKEYGGMEDKKINGCTNTRNIRFSGSKSNGPHNIEPTTSTLKSNLKKATTSIMEGNQERRKVTWPDAHGKDIAHVQEFEPSVSEDGELEGVRNSCVCAIQ